PNVLRLFASTAESKKLALRCRIDDSVPDLFLGDRTRINQVLVNLVSNAVKFTDEGEVTVRVSAQAAGAAQQVSFEVTDTGIGIPPGRMTRFFGSFRQAPSSTTRRFGGSGLGLVIPPRLCDLMGGSLPAASDPGHGSTFTARIQVQPASAVPPKA